MVSVPYRVLVIDDDTGICALLKMALERRGHQAFVAPDAESGVALAVDMQPHVILLDLSLPRYNGHDIYQELQRDTRTTGIPVLICSGSVRSHDAQHLRSMPNIVDVIAKPFDIYNLMIRLEEICAIRTKLAA